MVYHVKGSLLEAEDLDYICHQVNCQGRMGSGIAKAIRDRWPEAYNEYRAWHHEWEQRADEMGGSFEFYGPTGDELMLGNILIHALDDNLNIIHMAAQQYYGYDGRRYTSYDAFWSCLGHILEEVPEGSKIGFPSHIGCGLGGGNWEVIKTMIEQVLDENYEVYIYYLEE